MCRYQKNLGVIARWKCSPHPVIDIFMGQGAVEINAVPLMQDIILAIEIDRQRALQHIATFLALVAEGLFIVGVACF